MKRQSTLFAAFILAISINTFAQGDPAVVAEARRRVAQPPKFTRLESAVVRVPMVGTKTLPLVNVMLNGEGPFKFLVDTLHRRRERWGLTHVTVPQAAMRPFANVMALIKKR